MLCALVSLVSAVCLSTSGVKRGIQREKRSPAACLFAGARKCETLFKSHLAEHNVVK